MSDNIPFELQTEIINKLPVKPLLRFRSVCKSWKSLIDSSDFITHYTYQHQHLLIRYKHHLNFNDIYVSVVDNNNNAFPLHNVSLNIPPLVNNIVIHYTTIGTSHGLFCLFDKTDTAVIWNPSVSKAVTVVLPNVVDNEVYGTVLGFAVCGETKDSKIVKVNYIKRWTDLNIDIDSDFDEDVVDIPWQVEVFTLSTGAWRSVSRNLPRNSIGFRCDQVVIDECVYWLARDRVAEGDTFRCVDLVVSFDMMSEEFGEVRLPDSLAHGDRCLSVCKLRESLVVVEDGVEDYKLVYNVWRMEDSVPKLFQRLFTISSHSPDVSIVRVCGFRKTGEALVELQTHSGSANILAAYEPDSKSVSHVGINGGHSSYYVYSYMETLLLH